MTCRASSTTSTSRCCRRCARRSNLADRADFCVGYFNLRGWKQLDELHRALGGRRRATAAACSSACSGCPRMNCATALSLLKRDDGIDNQTAIRLKKKLAEEFRDQLTLGVPTNEDEAGLRRLAAQITAKKVVVKLFLRHPLHAKLYLLFRPDPINPIVGYLGSSNLTFAGLSEQGELNVDVLDHDACQKLAQLVRGPLGRPLVHRHLRRNWSRSSTRAGRARSSFRPTTSTSRWPTTCRRRPGPA